MKNLRTVRLSKGLTQQALGQKTAVSQASISRIEAGFQEPGYRTVLRIARALGVDPDGLIGSDGPWPAEGAEDRGG